MRKNPWYWTCPDCGANLDHGEKCDCHDKENAAPQAGTLRSGRTKNICKAIIA